MIHCGASVGAAVNVKVGKRVEEVVAVGLSVGEGVGARVTVLVGGGSGLAVKADSNVTVGEDSTIRVSPPHPINNRAAIDIERNFFCKFSIEDD
jgi:hypothetical protein